MKTWDLDIRQMSWTTLASALLLLCVGLVFVWSASYRPGPDGEGYYTSSPGKQVVWMAIGACVAFAVVAVHYEVLLKHAYWLYAAALLLVLIVPIFGPTINGAKRWLVFGPLRVQPSEFLKIAVILALARCLRSQRTYRRLSGLILPALLTFVPMAVIARQPDLGTALMIPPIAFAALYAAGARGKHLGAAVLIGVMMMPAMWLVMRPYQRERVSTFFEQDTVDSSKRLDNLYHLIQSKTAIGSGGLTGKGIAQGTQNRGAFIPSKTKNNDFIFAVICEETGFVGAVALLTLFFVFFASALSVADRIRHPGGRLIVVGTVALFATQVVVNTAMTAGQLPTVGLPLPFISYGGSSMLTSFIGLGLILNVSTRRSIFLGADEFNHSSQAAGDSLSYVRQSA